MNNFPGTWVSLILRLLQSSLAVSSLIAMLISCKYDNFIAFNYLLIAMFLQAFWSFGLACLDVYALAHKWKPNDVVVFGIVALGDVIVTLFSLAAAMASSAVIVFLFRDIRRHVEVISPLYQISAILAFLSWASIQLSTCITLWLFFATL